MSNSNDLEKRYGLLTATAMVVGSVIGSGVFFKAEKVLTATGGDLPTGILSWIIGGSIMVICAFVFATMATRYEKCSGIMDYAEVTLGKTYSYFIGWFMATIYFPSLVSVLSWVSARYVCVLFGWDITGGSCLCLSAFFLIAVFVMNALTPKLAGKFQVSTTVIKLIPLFLMAIVGTIVGLNNGILVQNFTEGAIVEVTGNPLFTAVIATSFAYEGWICATSINAELRDAKKNLPLALTFGTIFVVIVYALYYVGLAGTVENRVMMASGEAGAKIAFSYIFQNAGGTLLFVFVIISCLGTLNGLMMAAVRTFYALAMRDRGPAPATLKQVDPQTNMPLAAACLELLVVVGWLVYFFGANLAKPLWFGPFCFDSSELPIITTYALYIPIFFQIIRKETELGAFKRYVMPALAIIASIFMMIAAYISHGTAVFFYLILFAVIMLLGALFMKPKK
jgi:APA family basic amino acid/polyamine antiporter